MNRLLLLLGALSLAAAQEKNCYFPNGTDTNELLKTQNTYQECGAFNKHSMCCRRNTSFKPDSCRSDGLCQNFDRNTLWRESCTDPLWEAEGCLKLCINGTAQIEKDGPIYDMANKHVQIKTCSDGSFCCGANDSEYAINCCNKGEGVWIVNGKVQSTPPSSTSSSTPPSSTSSSTLQSSMSSSTSSLTSTLSNSATSSLAPPDTNHTNSNTGAIVGGVVGGVGGLALIAGLIWFALRRKNAGATKAGQGPLIARLELDTVPAEHQPEKPTHPQELGESSPVELVSESLTRVRTPRELLA